MDWGGVEDVTTEAMTLFGLEVPNLFLTAAPRASGKFIHVGRILSLAKEVFHNVCGVIEGRALSPDYVSTVSASLSQYSLRIQGPFLLSACHWDHVTRPRFWWLLGEIRLPPVTLQFEDTFQVLEIVPQVVKRCWSEALEPGWKPFAVAHGLCTDAELNFLCFMPFVPGNPEDRMATAYGYAVAPEIVRARWRPDDAAQSPYQYGDLNLVVARNGSSRRTGVT